MWRCKWLPRFSARRPCKEYQLKLQIGCKRQGGLLGRSREKGARQRSRVALKAALDEFRRPGDDTAAPRPAFAIVICNAKPGHTAPDKIDPNTRRSPKQCKWWLLQCAKRAARAGGTALCRLMNKVSFRCKNGQIRDFTTSCCPSLKKELVLIISTDKDSAER